MRRDTHLRLAQDVALANATKAAFELSILEFELDRRLDEAEKIGVGFDVPFIEVAPSAPRNCEELELELVGQEQ